MAASLKCRLPALALVLSTLAGLVQSQVSEIAILNFTQKVDHSGGNNSATFQQQYQLVTDFFKPGGPILLYQGPEGNIPPITSNIFFDYARELGGIACVLEHRFFGKSFPEGFDQENPTLEMYAPLTLDNTVKDAVEFVNWIKKTVPGAENSKVFNNGGSYGGFLVAEEIIREPDTFYGTFAHSPALQSWGPLDIDQNPLLYAGMDVVSNAWFDASAEAATKVQEAMLILAGCLGAQNCSQALPDMNFCTDVNATQWVNVYSAALIGYVKVAQFNYPVPGVLLGDEYPLYHAVNGTLAAKTPGEVLRVPLVLTTDTAQGACIDPANANITASTGVSGAVDVIGRSFIYMGCNWYPVSLGSIAPDTLLPYQPYEWRNPGCPSEWIAPDFNSSSDYFTRKFNLTTEQLDRTERLIIVQGSTDQVAGVGSPQLTPSGNRNHSKLFWVEGAAHGDCSFSESYLPRGISQPADKMRDTQLNYLKEWLGLKPNWGQASSTTGGLPPPIATGTASSLRGGALGLVVVFVLTLLF